MMPSHKLTHFHTKSKLVDYYRIHCNKLSWNIGPRPCVVYVYCSLEYVYGHLIGSDLLLCFSSWMLKMWVVRSRMCSLRTSARTSSLPCSSLDLFSRISPRRWLCRLILSLFSWCRLALRCSRCPSSWERNNSSLPKVKKKKQQIVIFIVEPFLLKEQSRKTSHISSM